MRTGRLNRAHVPGGSIAMATVLLIGVLVVASGYFTGSSRVLLAGLVVTGLGVVAGIIRLIAYSGR